MEPECPPSSNLIRREKISGNREKPPRIVGCDVMDLDPHMLGLEGAGVRNDGQSQPQSLNLSDLDLTGDGVLSPIGDYDWSQILEQLGISSPAVPQDLDTINSAFLSISPAHYAHEDHGIFHDFIDYDTPSNFEKPGNEFTGPPDLDFSFPIQSSDKHNLQGHSRVSTLITGSPSAPAQEELGSNPIAIDRTARPKSKPAPKVCKDICDSGCDMAFNSEKMRGYHIYEVHKIKAYKCPYAGCNHETSRYDNAQAHRAKNCKSEVAIKKRLSALTTTKKTSKKRPRCSIKDLNPGVPIQRPQSSEIPPSPDMSANINATARADSQPALRNGGAGLVDISHFIRLRNGGSLAVDDPKAPSLPDSLATDELSLKDALERFERENANLKREVAHLKRQNDTYSFFFRRVFAPYHESRDCECNH
ncbi:hypothetical protein EYR41_008973 [Orbilia oligospora]|uniref:Uncharacterized protein n=1 Tax=Orbilia oligospora TaxID=2813651 RepID=A0A7C8PQX1_ORBOL|nr:hypothetical protein TWF751_004007 [Orbilia oligospora]TGJ64967.1 hypothetical protein EYR41_008973 [Orbilia oligospora]